MHGVVIKHFEPQYQEAARKLILNGLEEHWGSLDPAFNQDLADICRSYRDGVFLLAWCHDTLVGTGALIPESEGVARIVRMSVEKSHRREGVGGLILKSLLEQARLQGLQKVVLETTATWENAINFYVRFGFRPIEVRDGDLHFELELAPTSSADNLL